MDHLQADLYTEEEEETKEKSKSEPAMFTKHYVPTGEFFYSLCVKWHLWLYVM